GRDGTPRTHDRRREKQDHAPHIVLNARDVVEGENLPRRLPNPRTLIRRGRPRGTIERGLALSRSVESLRIPAVRDAALTMKIRANFLVSDPELFDLGRGRHERTTRLNEVAQHNEEVTDQRIGSPFEGATAVPQP